MKTVFQRALSLVMCLILLCSTVSVMTFSASAEESFSYRTYAQNSTKENIHYLMDVLDNALADANINETIDLKVAEINIDLTSIDAVCATLDRFRGIITVAKLFLGDLKDLNLKVFDEGMSRKKSGDYKIFTELLAFADANIGIIEKLLNGSLDLGLIGDALDLDLTSFKIGDVLKEGIADAIFADHPDRGTIKSDAVKDFDRFVYRDLMGLVKKETGLFEGITLNASTTVDALLREMTGLLINKHIVGLIKENTFSFASLGAEYADLDAIIKLDGLKGVQLSASKSLLDQLNDALGTLFKQVVPSYNGWVNGGYTKIGDNMRGLVHYVAKNGLKINPAGKTDEQLVLEIAKIISKAADTNGEKEVYNSIKDTKTISEMSAKLLMHISGKSYSKSVTYDHVSGDILIEQLGGTIPLYDEKGNPITEGSGKTSWEVLNSVLNFFLVDKNMDSYLGLNMTKSTSFFEKLDILLDFTADDGTADFSSEKYITGLINSLFKADLQGVINATAVKAYNFAGKATVAKFLCKTANNLIKNWADSSEALNEWGSFSAALDGKNIGNTVKILIETLYNRCEGAACAFGVIYGAIDNVTEKITVAGKAPTCTANGYAPTKVCTKEGCKNPSFSDSGDKIPATGHHYKSKVEVAAKCTTDGTTRHTCVVCGNNYTTKIAKLGHKIGSSKITKNPTCTATGIRSYYCSVCKGVAKTEAVPATGHKKSGWTTKKKATYTAAGEKVRTCTVCKATTDKQSISRLTLSKPSGLKASAVSTSSIKFSWKKVTGAESYILYYKTGSGKEKSVKTKKTSATVKKLKTGTTYKFRVVAVAGKYKSKTSSTVSGTTKPATVSLKDLRSKKKKEIIAEWKKISGVTGYEVMYSTSKKFTKKTTKTVTIKKQSTYKTIIKKLKSKKKYYVKVRAYKTVNKVKVYGAYSKVKNIKCK